MRLYPGRQAERATESKWGDPIWRAAEDSRWAKGTGPVKWKLSAGM